MVLQSSCSIPCRPPRLYMNIWPVSGLMVRTLLNLFKQLHESFPSHDCALDATSQWLNHSHQLPLRGQRRIHQMVHLLPDYPPYKNLQEAPDIEIF